MGQPRLPGNSCSRSSSPPPNSCGQNFAARARLRWRGLHHAFVFSPTGTSRPRTTAAVLRDLAQRALELRAEADRHEKAILTIVRAWRPEMLERKGVGPIIAATVLCAWSHPGRVRSEAAFAMLGGAAPIPANSGQVTARFRLNPYGDRQLNRAFHTVVLSRLRWDEETKAYMKRRTAEGKTPREIKRCLKRYVARELFRLLENEPSRT